MPRYYRRRFRFRRRRGMSRRRRYSSGYRRLRRRYRSRAIVVTRGIPGAMIKWQDYDFYANNNITQMIPVTSNADIRCINTPALGDAFNQRNGYRVKNLFLDINLHIVPAGSNAVTNFAANVDLINFLVVYDRQPRGVNPAITDILLGEQNSGGSPASLLQPCFTGMNLLNKDRFLILAHKRKRIEINLSSVTSPWSYTGGNSSIQVNVSQMVIRKNLKLRGLETLYNGSTTDISSISNGAIYLVTVGLWAPTPSTTAKWVLSGVVRWKFVDA